MTKKISLGPTLNTDIGEFLPLSSLRVFAGDGLAEHYDEMGAYFCPFQMVCDEGIVRGIAWPTLRLDGEVEVRSVALRLPGNRTPDRNTVAIYKKGVDALHRSIEQKFKESFVNFRPRESLSALLARRDRAEVA